MNRLMLHASHKFQIDGSLRYYNVDELVAGVPHSVCHHHVRRGLDDILINILERKGVMLAWC